MRVICPHCKSKALITRTDVLKADHSHIDLYCICTNAQACGASFICELAYKHTLKPPADTSLKMAHNLVKNLSAEETAALQLGMQNG